MKIIAVHLLNDFSGSPRVLSQLIRGWTRAGISVTVLCSEGPGLLSDIPGAVYHPIRYRWHANRFMRLINLLTSQRRLFTRVWRLAHAHDIVYINTVLPFAAALAAKINGCRVVYHLHETSVKPQALKTFLFGIMRWFADDVIYVSEYLAGAEPVYHTQTHILPNAIEQTFLERARRYRKKISKPERVLMVCSLKRYKGVDDFVALASANPELRFQLVLNATPVEIHHYFRNTRLPDNIETFPVQHDLHPFYEQSDVIINLSRIDEWVETFGLTILEGMAYGLPALVPPVGGVTELVQYGRNGYWADARNTPDVSAKLNTLLRPDTYPGMRAHAAARALAYSEAVFIRKSLEILGLHDLDTPSKKWNTKAENTSKQFKNEDFKAGTAIVNSVPGTDHTV